MILTRLGPILHVELPMIIITSMHYNNFFLLCASLRSGN